MTRLNDKIVLITGASSGIGAAMVRERAAAGARLFIGARRADLTRRRGNIHDFLFPSRVDYLGHLSTRQMLGWSMNGFRPSVSLSASMALIRYAARASSS